MKVMDSKMGADSVATVSHASRKRVAIDLEDGRQVVFWTSDLLEACGVATGAVERDLSPNATNAGRLQ